MRPLAKYLQKSVDNFGAVPIIIDMSKQVAIGQRVKFKGEEWNIAGVGAKTDTHIYLHMAHTRRGVHQKNGFRPVQQALWVEYSEVEVVS